MNRQNPLSALLTTIDRSTGDLRILRLLLSCTESTLDAWLGTADRVAWCTVWRGLRVLWFNLLLLGLWCCWPLIGLFMYGVCRLWVSSSRPVPFVCRWIPFDWQGITGRSIDGGWNAGCLTSRGMRRGDPMVGDVFGVECWNSEPFVGSVFPFRLTGTAGGE